MIWIIGGTSEAREIEEKIEVPYIISVATDEGKDFLKSENVYIGRLNKDEMEEFVKRNGIKAIFDLSHPYATIVSENAVNVAEMINIPYYRYERPVSENYENAIVFNSLESSLDYMKGLRGNFLITTGSKNASQIVKVRGENRFIFRVLPTVESIEILNKNGIQMKDIIAELGPFSLEQNLLTIKEKNIDYVLTKDSGDKGGFIEKMEAARLANAKVIVIGREKKSSLSLTELLKIMNKYI